MLAGVTLRCWALAGPLQRLDPDEAVTGLMAARIADGERYTYFAGQRYMGALEQYLQAPFAALAPGNEILLRLPQVALAAGACWLVYRIGARMLGERRAAVAAWLFAAGPAFNLMYGVKSRGAYGSALLAGLLGLLVALRHRRGRGELATGSAFGFCCGLAGWLSASAALLLIPGLCWLAGSPWRHRTRAALAGIAGGLLGAAPLLADWARNGVTTGLGRPPPSTPGGRLAGLIDPVLPEFLGLSWRAGEPILPAPLAVAAGLALLAVTAAAGIRRRHGLRALVTLRPAERRPPDLLLLAVPVAGVLYLGSSYTWYTAEPRYLFVLYPVLALGLAALLPTTGRAGRWAPVLAVGLTAALATGTLEARISSDSGSELARAAAFLAAAGQNRAYADYQLAYPLSYHQGSKVTAVPFGANAGRFPDLRRAVVADPRPAYAVSGVTVRRLTDALARHGVRYRMTRFGRISTFTDLQPARTPQQLGLAR